MVDPITTPIRPIASDRSVTSVTRSASVARTAVDAGDTPGAAPAASALAAAITEQAATPPVDHDRVARIRHAIATNSYPILPETIADRLLALKLNWIANDPS